VLFNESHASVSAETPREPIPFENARPKYAVRIEIKAERIEKMWVPESGKDGHWVEIIKATGNL
jgi:hypothetical protein